MILCGLGAFLGWLLLLALLAPLVHACWLPLAFALARLHFRGQSFLMSAALLPLMVPPVLLGIGLLPTLQALGLWGTSASLAFAHVLCGMPLVCWLTRQGLADVNPDLERAARGLGAGPWQVVWRSTLPLILPAILAGALLGFVLSLNEFIACSWGRPTRKHDRAWFGRACATRSLPWSLWHRA